MKKLILALGLAFAIGIGHAQAQCTVSGSLMAPGAIPANLPNYYIPGGPVLSSTMSFEIARQGGFAGQGVGIRTFIDTLWLDTLVGYSVNQPPVGPPAYTPTASVTANITGTNAGNPQNQYLANGQNIRGCVDYTYSATAAGEYQIGVAGLVGGIAVVDSFLSPQTRQQLQQAAALAGIPLPPLPDAGDTLSFSELANLTAGFQPLLALIPPGVPVPPIPNFSLNRVPPGAAGSNLRVIDTTAVGIAAGLSAQFQLRVFPNPATEQTAVSFQLAQPTSAAIRVVDIQGRVAATLAQGNLPAGEHRLALNPANLAPGLYFVEMNLDGQYFASRVVVR